MGYDTYARVFQREALNQFKKEMENANLDLDRVSFLVFSYRNETVQENHLIHPSTFTEQALLPEAIRNVRSSNLRKQATQQAT